MKLCVVVAGPDVSHKAMSFLTGSFEERLDKAVALGYDGIELMVRDPNDLDIPALCRAFSSRDLEVPQIVTGEVFGADGLCLVSPDPNIRRRAEERTRAIIDLAAELGAMVNIGRLRGRLDWMKGVVPDPWAYAVERLSAVADYAAERRGAHGLGACQSLRGGLHQQHPRWPALRTRCGAPELGTDVGSLSHEHRGCFHRGEPA